MSEVHRDANDGIERLRVELQVLRALIADLQDRSLDGVDSLLSVVQSELERVIKEREQHR